MRFLMIVLLKIYYKSVAVKEFWKSVNIWWNHEVVKFGGSFWTTRHAMLTVSSDSVVVNVISALDNNDLQVWGDGQEESITQYQWAQLVTRLRQANAQINSRDCRQSAAYDDW